MATGADEMSAGGQWQDFDPKRQQGWQDYAPKTADQTDFEKQRAPENREGFWKAAWNTVKGIPAGVVSAVSDPFGTAIQTGIRVAENDAHRKEEGRAGAYRGVAGVEDAFGVDTRGMEDAADRGDQAGVLGHGAGSAVPYVAPFAAKWAGEGVGAVAKTRVGQAGIAVAKTATPDFISAPVRRGINAARESWRSTAPRNTIPSGPRFPSGSFNGIEGEYVDTPAAAAGSQPRYAHAELNPRQLPASASVSDYSPYRRGPGEVPEDDIRGPQEPNFVIVRPPAQLPAARLELKGGEPGFLSDQETADYGLQGGMRLPSLKDAKFGNLEAIYENQERGFQFPSVEDARLANSQRTLNDVAEWRKARSLYDPLSYQEGATPAQAQATRDFFHSQLRNWRGDPIAVRPMASEYAPVDLSQDDLTPALEESLRRAKLAKEKARATRKGPTKGDK